AEAVELLQERAVGAAGKTRRLLVHHAERQQLRGLELRDECALVFAAAYVDLLQAQHLGRRQSMAPVGSPEATVHSAHDDDRIEKYGRLVDPCGQTLGVRRR